MQRMRFSLFSLALCSAGFSASWAQEGDWKPARGHAARYQSADASSSSLLGKPVVGSKARVDRQLEPAAYSPGDFATAPLPPAPPGQPVEHELLPFPKTMMTASPARGFSPAPVNPGFPGGQVRVEQIQVPPTGSMGSGPVISSGPLPPGVTYMPGEFVGADPCANSWCGGAYRSYLSAPHGSPGIWYGSFDFLSLTITEDTAPPLVTTGPQESNGVIGQQGVRILYGGDIPQETLIGGRVTLGVWFNRCQTWGMFGTFFMTGESSNTFEASSQGNPLLARPFFGTYVDLNDNLIAQQLSELVAQTGVISGSVSVNNTSRLLGADLNFRFNWFNGTSSSGRSQWHSDYYMGVKYWDLKESLRINEDLMTVAIPEVAPAAHITVQDMFQTDNNFLGANLGFMNEFRWGRLFVSTRYGIAIGATRQQVIINGSTSVTPEGGATDVQPLGLLAQDSNSGKFGKNVFSVVPEFGINLGLQVTDHMRVYIGYDVMYWSNVVRPGKQIDYTINPKKLPGFIENPANNAGPIGPGDPNRPTFTFQNSNLWMQGFSAGLQWIF